MHPVAARCAHTLAQVLYNRLRAAPSTWACSIATAAPRSQRSGIARLPRSLGRMADDNVSRAKRDRREVSSSAAAGAGAGAGSGDGTGAAAGSASGERREGTKAAPLMEHDTVRHRFAAHVGEHSAFVEYRLLGGTPPDRIDLFHTFTPPELRGMGLASRVVKRAFEWAKANGVVVLPSCHYVSEAFLQRHPEYLPLTPCTWQHFCAAVPRVDVPQRVCVFGVACCDDAATVCCDRCAVCLPGCRADTSARARLGGTRCRCRCCCCCCSSLTSIAAFRVKGEPGPVVDEIGTR